MPLDQLEKRKEWAIQKAVSMNNLLMSPFYDDLKVLYEEWKAENVPGQKTQKWKDMEVILNAYGFQDLKTSDPASYSKYIS